MKFTQLEVYIQLKENGDLRARVCHRGEQRFSRTYGSDLLKGLNIGDRLEAMSKVAEKLLGTTDKIMFSFEPRIQTEAVLFEYPPTLFALISPSPLEQMGTRVINWRDGA